MKTKKLFITCLILFSITFFTVLSVSAYTYVSKGLKSVPSSIYYSSSFSSAAQQRCKDAMETWNNTCFSYDCLMSAGTTSVASPGVEDDCNTITFFPVIESYLGTTFYTQKKYTALWLNWYLVEYDININAEHQWFTNEIAHSITLNAYEGYFDLETTVLHELGHVLGLGHAEQQYYNEKLVVMYFSNAPQTTIRDLSEDDRLGVVNLY